LQLHVNRSKSAVQLVPAGQVPKSQSLLSDPQTTDSTAQAQNRVVTPPRMV
jgi:hypothetical protein